MRKRVLASLAIGVLVVGIATMAEAANLILNGSFELGNYNDTQGYQRLLAGSTDLTGWTVGGVGVDWHVGTENPAVNPAFINRHFGPAQDGSLVIDLHLDGSTVGTISQTFNTIAGMTYNVSFYLAGQDWFLNPRDVIVDVNGVSHTFSQPASPQFALVWGLKSFSFTAAGATSSLMFSSTNVDGFWGPLLDNVAVQATPLPATMLLMGTGFVALVGSRLRKRT